MTTTAIASGASTPRFFDRELSVAESRFVALSAAVAAAILVGLLQRDPNSYLYLDAAWKPAPPIAPAIGRFGFVDLLRYAGAA